MLNQASVLGDPIKVTNDLLGGYSQEGGMLAMRPQPGLGPFSRRPSILLHLPLCSWAGLRIEEVEASFFAVEDSFHLVEDIPA